MSFRRTVDVPAPAAGSEPALGPPPANLVATRLAMHRLAAYVVSPARQRAEHELPLRSTSGGFGTPFFGSGEQIRVAGHEISREGAGSTASEPITSLAAAAPLVLDGPPDHALAEALDLPEAGDVDAALPVDPAAATWIGEWFGFVGAVLEELRGHVPDAEPSDIQPWPEHFDAAVDLTTGAGPGTVGGSPGDSAHDEPYLYVSVPAGAVGERSVWNDPGFAGVSLWVSDLVGADRRSRALRVYRHHLSLLER